MLLEEMVSDEIKLEDQSKSLLAHLGRYFSCIFFLGSFYCVCFGLVWFFFPQHMYIHPLWFCSFLVLFPLRFFSSLIFVYTIFSWIKLNKIKVQQVKYTEKQVNV